MTTLPFDPTPCIPSDTAPGAAALQRHPDPDALPISDLCLHALFRLGLNPKNAVSLSRLHGSITGLRADHLQPALDAGWITAASARRHSKSSKENYYRLTDRGESLLRCLVQLAQSSAKVHA